MLDKYSWGDFSVAMASLYLIYYIWFFYKYILPGLGNKSGSNDPNVSELESRELDDDDEELNANEFINNSNKRLHDIDIFNNIVKEKENNKPELDFDEGYYEEEEISAEEIIENVHYQKIIEDGNDVVETSEPIFTNFSDDNGELEGEHKDLQITHNTKEIEEIDSAPGVLEVPLIAEEIEEVDKTFDDQENLGNLDGQGFNFDIYMDNDPDDHKVTEANVVNPEKANTKDSDEDDDNKEGFNFDKYI